MDCHVEDKTIGGAFEASTWDSQWLELTIGAAGNTSTRLEMSLAGREAFSTKQKAIKKKSVAISQDDQPTGRKS